VVCEGVAEVAEQPGLSFAGLLRQLRAEARLTQEELAEAAGLSTRSVSDLERGISRTAHKDTARLLADALGLAEPVRAPFVAAARGKSPPQEVLAASREEAPGTFTAAATRTLPRDTVSFTGRGRELARMLEAITRAAASGVALRVHAIDGMAGIGKTTFAVHAAHELAGSFPDGQFFLSLHAHTSGQRPVDPADALASLLITAGVAPQQIPPGLEARAARWRDHVAGKKILLLLDDAAGHEQVRPLLPGTAGSLVLITSRRRLAALQDAAQISLDTMPPEEAAVLLARLAARPDVRAGDVAVGQITRLCGYLPLAIGMLASQLRNHPVRTCAGLAAELSSARDRLALMHAENLSVAAAFGMSYADLASGPQRLFRRLGLVPGPSIDAYAAAALDGMSLAAARRQLDELYDQHLLAEPEPGRYQLHDLLREHARTLAGTDERAGSGEAVQRLLNYYLHTALAAGQHFSRSLSVYRRPLPGRAGARLSSATGFPGSPVASTSAVGLAAGRPPAQAPALTTLRQAAVWQEAERANLHAAADYAASHACFPHAFAIPALMSGFLSAHGHWDQSVALHRTALGAARRAGDQLGEADTLAGLGVVQRATGDYPAAAASLDRALALYGDAGDLSGQASVLNEMGFIGVLTGDYPAGVASQQRALGLARRAGDRRAEGTALSHLGLMQHLTGDYPAATASQQQALALFRGIGDLSGQACVLNDLGVVQQETGDHTAAAASHQQALALFGDLGNLLGQAEALNRLGELATRTADTPQARQCHTQALAIARDLSAAPEEARAIEGLGQSHLRDGDLSQAGAHLQQALTIYLRIGAPAARRVQQAMQNHKLACGD
jgi:tetratricopeptide (TPR) repeat protein/transcriptional regulator with XRE-family HTH domain